MLSNRGDAEDAAQRALVKLFQNAASFDREGDVVSWALAIATWESRTMRRSRRTSEEMPVNLAASGISPEDDTAKRELEAEATRLMGTLSTSDRDTLAQAFSPDSSISMASTAFRKRKERALDRLRARWRKHHGPQ